MGGEEGMGERELDGEGGDEMNSKKMEHYWICVTTTDVSQKKILYHLDNHMITEE